MEKNVKSYGIYCSPNRRPESVDVQFSRCHIHLGLARRKELKYDDVKELLKAIDRGEIDILAAYSKEYLWEDAESQNLAEELKAALEILGPERQRYFKEELLGIAQSGESLV